MFFMNFARVLYVLMFSDVRIELVLLAVLACRRLPTRTLSIPSIGNASDVNDQQIVITITPESIRPIMKHNTILVQSSELR